MADPKKILLVEDDNMLRNIIMSQLIPPYTVIPARDGEEAILHIEQDRPDIIILDLILPKLDGFGVLERLRALPDSALAQTPVIVISNLSDKQNTDKAQSYGVLAYFTKANVTITAIVDQVNQILNIAETRGT